MSGGIYVHIPFCKSRCAYCSFVSGTDFSGQKIYVAALLREIERRAGFDADTVYIGGGTPSTLYRGAISAILQALRAHDRIAADAEITIEANPDSASDEFFSECRDAGVNRISLGLQTTSDALLGAIGRIHTFAQFMQAFERAKQAGMRISVDLMLGLPGQTERDALDSLETVLRLDPGHISLYALSVEENTPLYARGYVPDTDRQAAMYDACRQRLAAAEYARYEVSNFARAGQESRHNLKYWTMQPYLGLGAAAHSFDGRTRCANTENVAAYVNGAARTEICESDDELREEYIMLALRTAYGLDLQAYKARFRRDLLAEKKAEIERLTASGLLDVSAGRLRLNDDAFYIMNSIIIALI